MRAEDASHMLNFTYVKTASAIITKATEKAKALEAKIAEREKRIEKTRKEYDISDVMMMELLAAARQQMVSNRMAQQTYQLSKTGNDGKMTEETVTIGAGVVNMLFTERDFIESEKAQIRKLRLVIRNLEDLPDDKGGKKGHELTNQELEYLGF